jgi:dihydroorotate dehydrogenase
MVMSGTQGFYGEGYAFHHYPFLRKWLTFKGAAFVSKTTTAFPTPGNMRLRADYQPRSFKPDCIWVDLRRGMALNAVGLSGPGANALFKRGHWQARAEKDFLPFMISFMPTGTTLEEKVAATHEFVRGWKMWMQVAFRHKVAIQLNISCPNVKADFTALLQEVARYLEILAELGVPIVVKINLLVTPEAAVEITRHPACAGLCVSNTIPFGELPDQIPWKQWFPNGSPLEKRGYGPGGLSGKPMLPILAKWFGKALKVGLEKPATVGGGILRPYDVNMLKGFGLRPGYDSISIGSIAMLRPWNVPATIERAHALLA